MSFIKQKVTQIPFVEGFALQNYSQAEKGILDAYHAGYQYWYIDGSLTSEIPKRWDKFRIENMVGMIGRYNVRPIFHGNFKVPLSSDVDEIRTAAVQYVKKEIDLASYLSAPLILHGGVVVEPRLVIAIKELAIKNFLASIEELSCYALTKNVTLYLENLSNYKNYKPFHYIFTHDREFEYITSATDAKFFLDLGHANIGNESPEKIFLKYCKRIVGMSFSNNNGQQDQHFPIQKGSIDYRKIFSAIHASGWKGIVAFETRTLSPEKDIESLISDYYRALNLERAI